MSFIQSFILGIIQGLTEFLPISSSAHLVLVPYLFNWSIPEEQVFPFDVLIQLGTLLAVIIYFWNDLLVIIKGFFKGLANKEPFKEFETRMGWYLILATIPAGILGLLVKSQVEAAFSSPKITALFLFVTAGLLLLADLLGKRTRTMYDLTWWDAVWIGVFQALSIFPGISRSGATIAGGMTRNLDRSSSARFSFLMSIPVMLGASLVSIKDLVEIPNLTSFLPILLLGFISAAITGYLSIHWLLSYIKRQKLFPFAIYCAVLACVVLLVGALNTDKVTATPQANPSPTVSTSLPASVITGQPVSDYSIIRVGYTPAMTGLLPAMSDCANGIDIKGLVTQESSTASLDLTNNDLIIRWGAPDSLANPAYQIGSEKLSIIVNLENPLVGLSSSVIHKLFNGQFTTWGDLYAACPDCFIEGYDKSINGSAISLAFYSKEEDIQKVFIETIMNDQPIDSAAATLIPDPQAMTEFVQQSKTAIGFLPASDLGVNMKQINLTDLDTDILEQPILVIAHTPPQGRLREFLLCVQNSLNP